ncbi:hypothetical protein NZ698_08225 [Chryseobacterium sp. PBS4-4]|uniref:Glycosyltransferase RgtA/B/C/D-like domain-containing protein n=1 Tax=Chryseobacterium edaphi TaxID=2976532 RepID=A0ABT2W4N2_9FLAO|nr:hypothetical protein [Chryseobacterium edaphi]MCU7617181.1 hypothetical protein [Chryseobacterium edaphi]
MYNKKTDLLFYLSPLFLLLSLLVQWNVKDYCSHDSQFYFSFAEKLPIVSDSLYPIFYPILLRITNLVFNNYLISYKALTIFAFGLSFLIVKYYNFFWKEFFCLLSFTSFFKIAPWAWSEIIMVPLFIMYMVVNYQLLTSQGQRDKKLIALNIFLLLIMAITKYSSIFILASIMPFCLYLFFKKSKEKAKDYVIIFLSGSILVFIYLLLNKYNTGEFMGIRSAPDFGGKFNIRLSLSFILFNLNPFFHGRQDHLLGFINFEWQTAYVISTLLLIVWCYLIRKSLISGYNNKMIMFCLSSSLTFLGLTIYSYLTTRIDVLDFRLLLPFYFFFFSSLIFSVKSHTPQKDVILLLILSLSITINFSSIIMANYNFL